MKRKCYRLLLGLFFLLAAGSAGMAALTVFQGWKDEKAFAELAALADAPSIADDTAAGNLEEGDAGAEAGGMHEAEEASEQAEENGGTLRERLARVSVLSVRNSDFAGWLTVPGTRINYPVMLTPDEPEYYLHRNFDGKKSASGTPFFGNGCLLSDNSILIYGHHMKNETMFADLMKYAEQSFYALHPILTFDTTEDCGQYEILAAFYETVHRQDETDVFRYYEYGGELDRERFEEYLSKVREAALYDTGVSAVYGDRLLTLSTCAYQTADGRFVVVAKKL